MIANARNTATAAGDEDKAERGACREARQGDAGDEQRGGKHDVGHADPETRRIGNAASTDSRRVPVRKPQVQTEHRGHDGSDETRGEQPEADPSAERSTAPSTAGSSSAR